MGIFLSMHGGVWEAGRGDITPEKVYTVVNVQPIKSF